MYKRQLYDNIKGTTPYCMERVAVLNCWGKMRAWGNHMVHHAIYFKQNYSYAGIIAVSYTHLDVYKRQFFYGLMYSIGGDDFFQKATHYAEGVWDSAEAAQMFDIVSKLASYTEKTTVANANNDNYLKNQQLVVDNKALFMPNGTWVVGEMKDVPKPEGFEWGFAPIPAAKAGGDLYSYTFFEQIWSPKKAENPELADKFIAFLYSDKAADIFRSNKENPAIQPITGISDKLEGESKMMYGIYNDGTIKPALGAFATTDPVEGVSMAASLFLSLIHI